MSQSIKIINITPENAFDFTPGPSCFVNPKQAGAQMKLEWMKQRFKEGLTIKVLYLEDEQKSAGFIEYIPGEHAWRAVNAPDYLFIHCIWIYPNKQKDQGYASQLLEECISDAKAANKNGVAVITSEGSFMAGKSLFSKNGFIKVANEKPSFELLVHNLRKGPPPSFNDWRGQLANYQGLHFIYSNQCPWVARSIEELTRVAKDHKLSPTITELKTAREAQHAPSIYGTFNLIYDGRLLADHYISKRRFENIINKQILAKAK
jgi:ribosomal protein S18 acetylase RimI-like enzyme